MKTVIGSLNLTLRDLLTILIPGGAMLCFISLFWMNHSTLITKLSSLKEHWVYISIFLAMAYFMGYIIYVFSSFFDRCYDKIKRYALEMDKGRNSDKTLEYIHKDSFKIYWWPLRFLFPNLHDTHNLIVKSVPYKNRDIGTKMDGYRHQTYNVYQYAYRRLMLDNETMFAEAENYFSIARFFRSMTLVLLIGTFIWLFAENEKRYALGLGLLCIISFLVYLNRWRKANHVALKNLILLEGRN